MHYFATAPYLSNKKALISAKVAMAPSEKDWNSFSQNSAQMTKKWLL